MYPRFVRELIDESEESPDLREQGTIAFLDESAKPTCQNACPLDDVELSQREPLLTLRGQTYFLPESSVDPRALGCALIKAAKRCGVDFVTGSAVRQVVVEEGHAVGVRTGKSQYRSALVVNCAGAWAAQILPLGMPTRPVKGQIVCVVPQPGSHHAGPLVQHVVRTPEVYIIPRSDGRILLGATIEEAGFDKSVDPDTVQRLNRAAVGAVPMIREMRIHDAWAGLRPASPDDLPILGESSVRGYYAATGHYRDGIMLAPVTAYLMVQLLTSGGTGFDLASFSPQRFANQK
jgi:glycine/D-amino acid oxidase-like deaminating enzyme